LTSTAVLEVDDDDDDDEVDDAVVVLVSDDWDDWDACDVLDACESCESRASSPSRSRWSPLTPPPTSAVRYVPCVPWRVLVEHSSSRLRSERATLGLHVYASRMNTPCTPTRVHQLQFFI